MKLGECNHLEAGQAVYAPADRREMEKAPSTENQSFLLTPFSFYPLSPCPQILLHVDLEQRKVKLLPPPWLGWWMWKYVLWEPRPPPRWTIFLLLGSDGLPGRKGQNCTCLHPTSVFAAAQEEIIWFGAARDKAGKYSPKPEKMSKKITKRGKISNWLSISYNRS